MNSFELLHISPTASLEQTRRAYHHQIKRWRRALNAKGKVRTTIAVLNVPPALAYQFTFPGSGPKVYESLVSPASAH